MKHSTQIAQVASCSQSRQRYAKLPGFHTTPHTRSFCGSGCFSKKVSGSSPQISQPHTVSASISASSEEKKAHSTAAPTQSRARASATTAPGPSR